MLSPVCVDYTAGTLQGCPGAPHCSTQSQQLLQSLLLLQLSMPLQLLQKQNTWVVEARMAAMVAIAVATTDASLSV
jgi:hypothetical protein